MIKCECLTPKLHPVIQFHSIHITGRVCWYVLSFSDFIRFDYRGGILLDSRELSTKPQPGEAMWSSPLKPHTLRNLGQEYLRVIAVELKGDKS